MKNKIIDVGLLAYGMSGKIFHAPFLDEHEGFNLCAVVERSNKKAHADYPNLTSYDSVAELLDDKAIELVVINTPNYLHYEHTKAALLKGKHVLVDKPFTATVKQAKELLELADKQQRKILFYQNRRWNSDYLSVKKVLKSGKLGKLNELHIRFDRYRNEIGPKTFKETAMEASGLLYDLGPHLLDQVISLFGPPISYNKYLGKNRVETQVDDYFFIQMTYPDNLNVTLCSSMLTVNPQAAFVLHGTDGSYIKYRTDTQEKQLLEGMKPNNDNYGKEQSGEEGVLSIIDTNGIKTDHNIPSERGNYMALFEALYQSLVYDKPYPITREEVLMQLQLLEN